VAAVAVLAGRNLLAAQLSGRAGGSGVVIISANIAAAATSGSPIFTTSGGRYIYEFRSSGSITF
jgi:hypothetical protein